MEKVERKLTPFGHSIIRYVVLKQVEEMGGKARPKEILLALLKKIKDEEARTALRISINSLLRSADMAGFLKDEGGEYIITDDGRELLRKIDSILEGYWGKKDE